MIEISRKRTVQLGRMRRRMHTQFRWRRHTGCREEGRSLYRKTRGGFPLGRHAGNVAWIGRASGGRLRLERQWCIFLVRIGSIGGESFDGFRLLLASRGVSDSRSLPRSGRARMLPHEKRLRHVVKDQRTRVS